MLLVAEDGLCVFCEEIFKVKETASTQFSLVLDKILLSKKIFSFCALAKQLKLLEHFCQTPGDLRKHLSLGIARSY